MADIIDDKGFNQIWKETKAARIRMERRANYMISFMDPLKDGSVLEIGSGTGEISYHIAKNTKSQVVGIDICKAFVQTASGKFKLPNLKYIAGDFNHRQDLMPIGGYDFIVGNGILHHFYFRIEESLERIQSFLKPGGWIVFLEPNLINPYCYLIFKIFRKAAKLDPEEMAFTREFINKKLKESRFCNIGIEYRDFLIPCTPEALIRLVVKMGAVLEKIPIMKALAQSIFISAKKKTTGCDS